LGTFTSNGAFTLNDAGGGLNVTGAVSTTNNGLASTTTTGGNLAVTTGSVTGAGVTLTANGAGNDITLNGALNGNAGPVTLTAADLISQTAMGTISTSGTLTGSAGTTVTLDQGNQIGSLGAFTSNGTFTLNDANGGLNVTGAVTTNDAGLASITTTGANLAVTTGSVAGAGVTLTANGAGNDITLNGAVNGNAGTVTLTANDLISQTASGTISTTGTLTGSAGTTVTLDQGNQIGSLGAFTSNGAFTLNDAGGGLNVTGAVNAGTGSVSITTAGGALALGANNVTGQSVSLTGVGVTSLAGSTVNAGAGDILVDGQDGAISLGGALTTTSSTATAVRIIDATSAALGNITTGASGTVTLGAAGADNLSGAVSQTGVIDTGTLIGNTGSTVALGNGNTITNLGAFTSNGALTLNDAGGGLNVTGAVSTTNNGLASITTAGGNLAVTTGSVAGSGVTLVANGAGSDITLNGVVNGNAGTVTLTAADLISQTATGTISTSGTLTGTAGTTVTLDQGNQIGSLGAFTSSGGFALNDTSGGLNITGVVGDTSGPVSIATAGGVLDIGANVTTAGGAAGTLTLTGVGINQTAGAIVATGATTVNAGGGNVSLATPTNDFQDVFTLNGAATGIINDVNTITFASPMTLTGSLTVTAPDIITGDVTTNGFQQYNGNLTMASTYVTNNNPFAVTGDTTLNSDSIVNIANSTATFGGTVNADANTADGQETLTIINSGSVIFNGAVGNVQPLGALTTPTGSTTINGGSVHTSGDQNYLGATSGNNLTLTSDTGDIVASNAGNDFAGILTVRGDDVTIRDANTLTLGTSSATTSATLTVDTGALDLGTLTVGSGGLTATASNGNITQTGAMIISGPTNVSAPNGSITLDLALNDFIGTINADGFGNIELLDANGMSIGTIASASGLVKLLAPNGDLTQAAGGSITAGGATGPTDSNLLESNGGADGQVLGLQINIAGNLTVTGAATLWNFAAGSDVGDLAAPFGGFSVGANSIGVQINGVTFIANLVQIQAGNVIGSVAGAAAAVIVDEANRTFGTDSVAEDVEYGFAGEIGSTPPMDHRIDESGISLPRCVQESRDGIPCK
jgi:hypothetical protein